MGAWYRVTKTIGGRHYHYWQQTDRVGKSVKTLNKYIGPAGAISPGPVNAYIGKAIGVVVPEIPEAGTLEAMRRIQHAEEKIAHDRPEAKRRRALDREIRTIENAIGKAMGREFVAKQKLGKLEFFARTLSSHGRELRRAIEAAQADQRQLIERARKLEAERIDLEIKT